MNILFLTISRIDSIETRGIYTDLMRKFRDEGHQVYIVSPLERQFKQKTDYQRKEGVHILRVKTLNLQKTSLIEKGIGTILIERQFKKAVKRYFPKEKFDLLLYSTPPITFTKIIRQLKIKYDAKSYLLLKDIFPQNAVDLHMFGKNSFVYSYFRRKEKLLYKVSDHIGCMSPANVEYIKKHNPEIADDRIEVCPNSIALKNQDSFPIREDEIRVAYDIPVDITTFIYGGNLGKPQGIDFFLKVLLANKNREDCFFVIAGSGTEYKSIENLFATNQLKNAKLLSQLPKDEYDALVRSCDIGLIFLDKKFTIPNYPSRLLSYLENKMPILAATDVNTDIGRIAEENQYGFWCENGDLETFNTLIDKCIKDRKLLVKMGANGYEYLKNNYTVDKSYQIIMKHFA